MIYIIVGFILGYIVSNIQGISSLNKTLKKVLEKISVPTDTNQHNSIPKPVQLKGTGRKGLMEQKLSSSSPGKKAVDVTATYEVYEIERSKDKSKIGIINIRVDKGEFTTDSYRKKMLELYDNAWITSTDIEWLSESPELVRDEKLTDLLD